MSELLDRINNAINEFDVKLLRGTEDHTAMQVVLLLMLCEWDDWSACELGAAAELGASVGLIAQLIANLRCGGALAEEGFHPKIRAEFDGKNGWTVSALLVNVALGRMRYLPDHGTYQMTPVGVAYVEQDILSKTQGEKK